MEKITLPDGTKRNILINHFPALVGWEIQEDYIAYVRSDNKELRKEFTIRVLSFAEVVLEEVNLPLQTVAVIENHLVNWQNIKTIFEAVLRTNGIDPESHAEKSRYWDQVGQDLAVNFIAEASKLIGPALAFAAQSANSDQPE